MKLHRQSSFLRWLLVVISIATLTVACTAKEPPALIGDTAIVDVRVVDIAQNQILENQTVLIEDGRIKAIAPALKTKLADSVQVIQGQGYYLAPGLSDMHAHVFDEDVLVNYLANGVTLVRNMWGDEKSLELRDALANGKAIGPRMLTAGPLLDGQPKIWAGSVEVADEATARVLVELQAAKGYDFVKTYSRLSSEVFDELATTANQVGIEFSGHIPQRVSMTHAIELGMRTSEHFVGAFDAVMANPDLPNPDLASFDDDAREFIIALGRGEVDPISLIDSERVAELGTLLAGSDHWLDPTWDIMKNFTSIKRFINPDAERYASPVNRQLFRMMTSSDFEFLMSPEQMAGEDILYGLKQELLGQLHQAGAKILTGTDDSLLNGFAVVGELLALSEAGLSNQAVLHAAMTEPANYLEEAGQFGVVAPGSAADLILIKGNPLEDLHALRDLAGVMRAGNWYSRADLDAMLAGLEQKYDSMEAAFNDAPEWAAEAGIPADYLTASGSAARIARSAGDEATITTSIRQADEWHTFTYAVSQGSITVAGDEGQSLKTVQTPEGWKMDAAGAFEAQPVAGDWSVILTGTPVDMLVVEALAEELAEGESRTLATWNCGADMNCADAVAGQAIMTKDAVQTIRGHRIWEAAHHYLVAPQADSDLPRMDFWIGVPGLYSGGPMHIELNGVREWQRIR